jgi:hypothetical protein
VRLTLLGLETFSPHSRIPSMWNAIASPMRFEHAAFHG